MPIDFTPGIPHTDGMPDHDPGITGGRVAYDYSTHTLYRHVSGTSWTVISTGGGGSPTATYPAGENLSSGRVVIIESETAFYFQPADPTHAGRAYGITTTSATTGSDVILQLSGQVQDAAFGFAADSVLWVGADGEIFDAPQAGVSKQKAGISVGIDKMQIDFTVQIIAI